jgi:hypothetical protein
MPESPKHLLLRGKHREAIDALNLIGWYNGAKHRFTYDDVFIEEETAKVTKQQEIAEVNKLVD